MEPELFHDHDEFHTPDSEDEGSTDVSNSYHKVSWTDKAPQPTELEDDPAAEPEEEGHTSVAQDSSSHLT